jgi:hypothetical protein
VQDFEKQIAAEGLKSLQWDGNPMMSLTPRVRGGLRVRVFGQLLRRLLLQIHECKAFMN